MRTITTTKTVYKYDELTPEQQESALAKHRSINTDDYLWDECTKDDAKTIGGILGIDPMKIYYSGFSSQGDGACFEGHYQHKADAPSKIREYAPTNEKLHKIADDLQAAQAKAGGTVTADIRHTGRYYHQNSVDFNIEMDESISQDLFTEIETEIVDALKSFMMWIYRALENDYVYQQSDEAVIDTIKSNDMEFEKNGDMV